MSDTGAAERFRRHAGCLRNEDEDAEAPLAERAAPAAREPERTNRSLPRRNGPDLPLAVAGVRPVVDGDEPHH